MDEGHSPYQAPNAGDERHDVWGEATGYRRVHWAAMTSVFLAVLAPLAIFIFGLIAIPTLGLIFGAIGYSHISKKPEIYAGKRIATIGLSLSLIFGLWSALNQYNNRDYLYTQALEQTRVWLTYIKEGKLGHAHQVMLAVQGRNHDAGDIEEFYQNDRAILEEQQARFARLPMKLMLDHIDRWEPADLRLLNNVLQRGIKKNEIQLVQEYLLPLQGDSDEAIAFRIQYWRQFFPEGRSSHWQIEGIGMLDGTFGDDDNDSHAGHNH